MPNLDALNAAVVACVGLGAGVLAMLSLVESLASRERDRRTPSDADLSARARRLALEGALPPGWTARDAARLLRIHARRARS